MNIYRLLQMILFRFDAEFTHTFSLNALNAFRALPFSDDVLLYYCGYEHESLRQRIMGLDIANPIGLAAGMDKDARYVKGLAALGFGYLELGSITKFAQAGNPKPRVFRHVQEHSLQNALGFNNAGSSALAKRLRQIYPFCVPLGINIGKNKDIAQEDALENYAQALDDVLDVGDYYTFNLSSPNTPNLRDLQEEAFVEKLFNMARKKTHKPLFIKISPDMAFDQAEIVCMKALDAGASGIIATNTSTDAALLARTTRPITREGALVGGISGAVLCEKSRDMLVMLGRLIYTSKHKEAVLISVGGIANAREIYSRIRLGAQLVQIFTGLVYQGPRLCARLNRELAMLLKADGFDSITQAVGIDVR